MTAGTERMLGRRAGRILALVVFAIAWIAAAALLWRTTVPSLDLDGFDEHRFFSARQLARAHDYEKGLHLIWLLGTIAGFVTLVVLMRILPRSVRGIGLGRVGTAVIVGMIILAASWATALPFGIAALWWQSHWDLGPFDIAAWLFAQPFGLIATGVFVMATIVLLVALAVRFPRTWWIPGGAVFVGLALLLSLVFGWIDAAGTDGVHDPALRADIRQLKRAEGVNPPVSIEKVSDWTDQANAFATGWGPSTHVVLWDTLLDDRFSRGEVRVVVAHEFGHVKHRHVLKAVAWYALFAFPTLFLVAEITRRRGGLRDPANLPLAVLAVTAIALVTTPFENAVSRRYEAEADWQALRTTHDAASARELFESFQRTSLQDPNPPLWAYLWLETHPTLMQRIAMAERYQEENPPG